MFSELLAQFNTNGYAVIDDFLSPEEIDSLEKDTEKLLENIPDKSQRTIFSTVESERQQNKQNYFLDSADKISYFFENGAVDENGELTVKPQFSLNKIGHALHELNDVFKKITLSSNVKETCYQLNFTEPVVPQSMYIFKNPGVGSEGMCEEALVTPHQDATYLYTDPLKVIGFWIALNDANLSNGCLKFIPGSHKSGVHRRYIKNPDKTSDELVIYDSQAPVYQKNVFVPVPVSKGSCILIDGQVVHCSEPNRSSNPRHAYTFHVIENYNTEYSKDNWLQPASDKTFLNVYRN